MFLDSYKYGASTIANFPTTVQYVKTKKNLCKANNMSEFKVFGKTVGEKFLDFQRDSEAHIKWTLYYPMM